MTPHLEQRLEEIDADDMRAIVIRYRNAIDALALAGVFRDAPALINDIESGKFDDEYEIMKQAAINTGTKNHD